jgi:hypothetical protein
LVPDSDSKMDTKTKVKYSVLILIYSIFFPPVVPTLFILTGFIDKESFGIYNVISFTIMTIFLMFLFVIPAQIFVLYLFVLIVWK